MQKDELKKYYGNHIDVHPSQLWWQNGGTGLLPLGEHLRSKVVARLVAGEDPGSYRHGDSDRDLDGLKELLASVSDRGFDQRIKAAIAHRGQVVITDGLHRSCIALALGLMVPVEIVYRAAEWWRLKEALCVQNKGTSLYQPINHPDLASWRGWRVDCDVRARIIGDFLASRGLDAGRGYDVGCNTGVVTCALARRGHRMVGLDTDVCCVASGNALAPMRVVGSWSDVENCALARFERCSSCPDVPEADFVVCLSLLNHHQVDGRSEAGQEIFRRLVRAAPLVFIDCPAPGDPVGGDSAFVSASEVLRWCAGAGVPGSGSVLAVRSATLMRTLLVWERKCVTC